jgi:hypothetical protein
VYQTTADPRSRQAGPAVMPRHPPAGEVVVIGAHGGAGVTTLAGLLRPAWDMGAVRRPGPGQRPLRPAGRPVVLVARSTAAAAAHAVTATGLLAAQGVQVTVLAVIGDGLPEPAEARYRFRVLDGRVGAVVRVPFIPAFRLAADPLAVTLPRRARRALAEIRALAGVQPYTESVTRP